MGIYIKKMEMPKSCSDCPMLDWDLDYIKCKVTGRHFKVKEEPFGARRVDDCHLVPVPPHGRLIDADALIESFDPSDFWNPDAEDNCFAAVHVVNTAPTIIPAEEGET